MAGNQHQNMIDPNELDRARAYWSNFVKGGEYTIIGVVIALLLMAAFLV